MPGLIWLQANCRLARPDDEGVHGVIAPLVAKRRTAGLRQVHFVRKPPGLRIRLGFAAEEGAAMEELRDMADSLLSPACESGYVEQWFASAYEPETYKYGGPTAMGDVDAHFAADTNGWSRRIALEQAGASSVDARLFSVCVINDLILRVVDGLDELWDVWCGITIRHGGAPLPLGAGGAIPVLGDLDGAVSAEEHSLLYYYQRVNRIFAARLQRRFAAGTLLFGFRTILPHIVMAHWNRYGFSEAVRQDICQKIMAALK